MSPSEPPDPSPSWSNTSFCLVATVGLSLSSGLGGLLGFYIPEYEAVGKTYADITALMTYPTLFM